MSNDMNFFTASAEVAQMRDLDVEGMKLVYRLECSGEDFYNELADRIDNAEAAELFRRNGREELGHAKRIARAIAAKLETDFEPSGDMLERFAIPLPDEISLDLLPEIVKAEIQGDAGYQAWADREPNEEVARLLRLNGREETGHAKRVNEAIAILEASATARAS
jgi:rubrerythrin